MRPQRTPIAGRRVLRRAGGCDFLADPGRRADETDVFWRPDELASAVILTAPPVGTPAIFFAPAGWPGDVIRRDADDGAHILVRAVGATHQLWLPDPPAEGAPLAAIVPLDASAPMRAEAAMRFWRLVAHGRLRNGLPKPHRLARLVAALRALDGRLDGANYRAIAEALFGARRVAAEPWKTASVRDTVIRLVRTGLATMRGDYKTLVKPKGPNRRPRR